MVEPDYLRFALALVAELKPHSLIAVGDAAEALARTYQQQAQCDVVTLPPGSTALPSSARYDLALLLGRWDRAGRVDAATLLSRLRDVHARRLLASLASDSVFQHGDLIGHGLTSLGHFNGPEGDVELFEFDIATYKTTPDWLNSKNWANPQLFDKYRW